MNYNIRCHVYFLAVNKYGHLALLNRPRTLLVPTLLWSKICTFPQFWRALAYYVVPNTKEWTGKTIYFNFSSIFGDIFLIFFEEAE